MGISSLAPLEFQFTHPGKGATAPPLKAPIDHLQFQFTHPGKGATRRYSRLDRSSIVSIHAPWEGCDLSIIPDSIFYTSFNSRTLGRVRQEEVSARAIDSAVSIHAPWEGCDGSGDKILLEE